MTIWIKICGLTTEEGVDAAVAAGADAVGFVFAPSKRKVTAERARELAEKVPKRVMRTAVMQHPSQALLDEVWSVFRPDVLQTDVEDLAGLRVPDGLLVMPVIRAGHAISKSLPSRIIFEGPVSGTGETTDWDAASRLTMATQVVLAGGLHPANVAAAIVAVQPFGVDVSSGVESAPGKKDPVKIHEFVRQARAAASGADRCPV